MDNTRINLATTLGDLIATDDVGGVKHELVKVEFGLDGVATMVSETDPLPVTVIVDAYVPKALPINTAGDNTVHTPAAGKAIRIHYILLNADGANTADVTATVKFAGAAKYILSLKPGAMWAQNMGAGRRYIQGGINEVLVVGLSGSQTVNVNFSYEEV